MSPATATAPQVSHQFHAPTLRIVNRSDIKAKLRERGRKAFITMLPFWAELTAKLRHGLGRGEAIEINLPSRMVGPNERDIQTSQLINGIRHQFHKLGLNKKYSMLMSPNGQEIFVVDHETAALTEALQD